MLVLGLAVLTGVTQSIIRPAQTAAATSSTINFQARLETAAGAIVPDGNYNVEFKLYNVSSGGTALWTEDYLNSASQGIQVVNGYLTANLGAHTSFPGSINWDQQLWLTMNIGGTGTGTFPGIGDGEMNPRLQLTALPYAFRAGTLADPANSGSTLSWASQTGARSILLPNEAGTLCIQNSANCGFLTGSPSSYIQNGTSPQTASFNVTGTGVIGTSLTTPQVTSTGALSLQSNTTNAVTLDSGTTGAVNIGTGANAKTIQIGTTTGAVVQTINIGNNGTVGSATAVTIGSATSSNSTVTIQAGTTAGNGSIQIGSLANGITQTINIGTNTNAAQTVTIGSKAGTSPTVVQGGTSGITLNPAGGSSNVGVLVKPTSDTTAAFQVQNAATAPMLTVDSANAKITVQNSTLLSQYVDATGTTSTISRVGRVSAGSATSYGTASYTPAGTFSPAAGRLLLAFVNFESANGQAMATDGSDITISGGSLTWVPITGKYLNNTGWGVGHRVFYAWTTGSPPSNMQVTVDAGTFNINHYYVSVDEMSGVDVVSPIAGATSSSRLSNSSNTFTATLSATPQTADWKILTGSIDQDNATHVWTNPGGWTEIHALGQTPDTTVMTQTGSTSTTLNYSLGTLQYANADTTYGGFILRAANGSGLNLGMTNATTINVGNSTSQTTVNGLALFQSTTNSTTAFQIQNATATPLFVADTTNSRLYVGNPTADAIGALLVLDTKNTSGDPSGTNGAMYYNSNTGKFRCYQGGAWMDCVGGGGTVTDLQSAYNGGYAINIPSGANAVQLNAAGSGGEGLLLTSPSGNTPFIDWYNGTSQFGIRSDDSNIHLGAWNAARTSFGNNFNLATNGSILLQNTTDSTTAFQVQNAAGTKSFLTVDTTGSGAIVVPQSTQVKLGTNATIVENSSTNLVIAETSGGTVIQSQYLKLQDNYNSYATEFAIQNGGQALFQNAVDSTTAFQVQNAAGTASILAVDTTHGTVGIASLPAATIGLTVWGGNSNLGIVVDQGSSNTNDLLNLRHNGTTVAAFGATGNILFKNSTDSSTAFQVQNTTGSSVFTVDTSNGQTTANGSLTVFSAATANGGGANGGSGSGTSGDSGGGAGGAIGTVNGVSNGQSGGTGAQSVDVSGLFSVLSSVGGYPTVSPGAAGTSASGYCTKPGGNATGFGTGGGGAGWYGGNGGNGLYGGGGGGAAGGSSCGNLVGGSGGQGVVVISPTGGTNTVKVSGTSYTVPAGITQLKIWAIGAGGGGAGASVDSNSGGAGGAGAVAYRTFAVTPGQIINYSLGTSGTGGTGTVNGSAGGATTVSVGAVTLTANGGAGGQWNNNATAAGGTYTGSSTVVPFQVQDASGDSLLSADTTNMQVSIAGNLNATTYSVNGTPGANITCASGASLQGATIVSGVITGGSCAGASYAEVYNSVAQTTATVTVTTMTFNSERQDTDNYHSTSSNTSRLTAPSAGFYHITANSQWAANTTGNRYLDVILNGTTVIAADRRSNAGYAGEGSVNVDWYMNAGDYVEMRAYQESGGNLAVTAQFSIFKTSAASGSGSGTLGIGAIDSQTKSLNGAVVSGGSLYLQTADASNPGLVSTTTQTFAGNKTFTGNLTTTSSSTSAFQVQNAGGTATLLGADSSANMRVAITGDLNIGNPGSRLFSDNFESGGLGFWDQGASGSIAASTAVIHDGKYSAQVNISSGSGYASATVAPSSTVYARSWIYVASNSTLAGLLNLQNTPSGQSFVVNRSAAGNLTFWDGVTGVTTDSGTAFTTGAWHLVEMRVTIGSSTGVSQVWLDGTQVVNLTSQNNGTNSLGTVKIGDSTGGRTFNAYFDDVVADTVTTGTASSLSVGDSLHVGGSASFDGSVIMQNTSDNKTAFQVQLSDGTPLLTADTDNGRITVGNDTASNVGASGYQLYVKSNNDVTIRGKNTGGSADLLQLANGTDNIFKVANGGATTIKTTTNATSAFQIQGSSGNVLFNVNSSDGGVIVGAVGSPSGTDTTPQGALRIVGTGQYGGLGRILIGDGNLTNNQNVWLGEWSQGGGTDDTDILQLQGRNGIYLSAGASASTMVGHFNYDSARDAGVLALGQSTSGSYLEFDNNNALQWSIGMDGADACGAGTPSDTLYFFTSAGGCALQFAHSNGQATFAPDNMTNAFQIQNTSGVSVFTADTQNSRIYIGSPTGDTTGTLLVLDNKTNAGDPTGVNGGMYYNSSMNSFRCYENGAWKNCINGIAAQAETYRGTEGALSAKAASGTILLVPIYLPGQITVNEMRIRVSTALGATGDVGLYNAAGTLVLNGGSGSLTTGTGLKTITPTQAAANRVLEAGQYYAAVTWNSTTGIVTGTALTTSGDIKRVGTLTGGGSVLPSSITPSSITSGTQMVYMSFNN
jgi:hypothetical protein